MYGRNQNGSNSSIRSSGASSMMAAITPGLMAPVKNYQTVPVDTQQTMQGGGAMLEGEWSTLNPNLYQHMSNDQVDWAALAQQWIQMKETLPAEMVPSAPPPPIISDNYGSNSRGSSSDGMRLETIQEQGEAPMEVERDEEVASINPQHHTQQPQSNIWNNGDIGWQYPAPSEWRNPAWDPNWTASTNKIPTYDATAVAVNPNASVAVANWQAKMAKMYKFDESSGSGTLDGSVQLASNTHQPGDVPKRIPGLMDQVINLEQEQRDHDEDTTQTINDAKRKLLPAWIREGLEKMEREKQRQTEKENEQRQREVMLEQRRRAELEALNEIENANKKSKFESDSELEDNDDDESGHQHERNREASPVPVRSREEILQELMVSVRKNLTEILLEVTNEEIALIAKETIAKTRRKAPTAQALRKTGLATLTGGLGLGMYGDSDDEDDSGSDTGRDGDGKNDDDDEVVERNLRATIRQRQKEFEWTAREIEDQLAQEEAREERKRREYELSTRQAQDLQQSDDSDDDDDGGTAGGSRTGLGHSAASGSMHGGKVGPRDGETQPVNDKLYAYKLGRSRDKRITRFSDPKDTVRQTHITHVAIVNHNPGDVVHTPSVSRTNQPVQTPSSSSGSATVFPSSVQPAAAPLFPAAMAAAAHLENYRRENSVASETPSNASSSRAPSSHRSGRDGHRSKSHKSHKSKKHKRSRYSGSDDEEAYYDAEREDDRYSQHSRRSQSSEQSNYSRRRRSYSRDSRDDGRGGRKHSYKSRDRSRSRDRYGSSRRHSRSRSRSSSRRRY